MSQLPPTPPFPDGGIANPMQPYDTSAVPGPVRWSAMAIAGFVLSLIGCVGVTAVLGFILGVLGLISTRGSRLRGRGLAIAALPISVVTGALSVLLLIGVLFLRNVSVVIEELPALLGPDPAMASKALTAFRGVCSDEFNDEVPEEDLRGWLKGIRERHGTLAGVQPTRFGPPGEAFSLVCEGEFVNGPAPVLLSFVLERRRVCRLDDIAIDGSSPRRPE